MRGLRYTELNYWTFICIYTILNIIIDKICLKTHGISPLTFQQDNVNALSKRLSEVSEELRKSEGRSHTFQHDMEKASVALRAITQERDGISQQMAELQRQDSGNKNTVATLEAKLKVRLDGLLS